MKASALKEVFDKRCSKRSSRSQEIRDRIVKRYLTEMDPCPHGCAQRQTP